MIFVALWILIWCKICIGIFEKMDAFKNLPEAIKKNPQAQPFIRTDAQNFNKLFFFIKGLIRAPFAFPLIIICHIIGIIYLNLICYAFNLEKEGIQNFPKVHTSLLIVQGILARIVLFAQGITHIKKEKIVLNFKDFPNLKTAKN